MTGGCQFPTAGSSYWQGYSVLGTELLRVYSTSSLAIDTATGTGTVQEVITCNRLLQ